MHKMATIKELIRYFMFPLLWGAGIFIFNTFEIINLIAIGIASFVVSLIILLIARILRSRMVRHMHSFNLIPEAGLFKETLPMFSSGKSKLPHIILMIHGFSASTSEFRYLAEKLKEQGIPYYAPVLSGFGLSSVENLRKVTAQDWIRDVLSAYHIASQSAEKVSIIAHSMGSMLAHYLIATQPVHKIVITSPYTQVKSGHRILKRLLLTPVISQIICLFNPTVKKNNKRDWQQLQGSGRFVYTAVPTESIRALWHLQNVTGNFFPANKDILLILGEKDGTIDTNAMEYQYASSNSCKVLRYANSGHNVLEEQDKDTILHEITTYLTEN
ncbi:MAG: alpha/beta fold hydrolase [Ignavibacteria bacterium]|nr:alpha/beta fold hydrolase [Ignavibacteria bacterium]